MRTKGPVHKRTKIKEPKRAKGLNHQQERFAHEYIIDLNATQAAIRAGYSKASAYVTGPRLLEHAGVSELIHSLLASIKSAKIMTAAEVQEELSRLARSRVGRILGDGMVLRSPNELADDDHAAISEITTSYVTHGRGDDAEVERITKVKLWDKVAALRSMAQIHKLIGAEVQVNLGADLAEKLASARKRVRQA